MDSTQIMDADAVSRALRRIAHEILERNRGAEGLCLIGIRRRGVPIAEILRENIERIEGARVPVGSLDITFYRDDLSHVADTPAVGESSIPFDISGKRVVLADDVLFTGRTARAAIEALFSRGRPDCVRLAILVDRGHRELPVRADFVGKNVPTALSERVSVRMPPYDAETGVYLFR